MLILLLLLVVLLVGGLGFVAHLLWVLAAVFLVLWLLGFVRGRREGGGRHNFYRW